MSYVLSICDGLMVDKFCAVTVARQLKKWSKTCKTITALTFLLTLEVF